MDFLKSAVASAISKGPLGGYVVADRVDLNNSVWTLHNATRREGDVRCSILTYDISANRSRLPIAKNAVRKARTLHHPGVIKVLDTVETESNIYLVTERLTPLEWFTRRKSLAEESIKWGLWAIARAIKFINADASSVHGCIRASSVFVSDSGEWKLGGFDILSSMNDDEAVIYKYASLVPDLGRYMPPEVSQTGWDVIKKNPLSAVDSYGYGALIAEAFNGSFTGTDILSQARGIPPSMQQNFKRLLNPNPKVRLSVAHFLEQGRRSGGFFQIPIINIAENMDNLGLKSDSERNEFLSELNEVSSQFPDEYLKRKVLPELIKSVEFGGGGPQVFSVVLQIGSKLSHDEYETLLTPVLIRLFASPDRALRVCLLDNLSLMIDHLSPKVVNDKVFPSIVTGFTDVAPVVREQTVKAVLIIVSKLSDRTVNGELLKYLARTANDEQPGIRTNTTICLGKLAKYLNNSTRTKVLVAAFTRSLRDPFVHARNAALMALAATAEMFSEEDSASKILPALCPSLLDKEKIIRDQANRTLDLYLQRIRKHGQTLPETALAPASSSHTTNSSSEPSAPRIGTPATDSSWAGWAISSFTNKLAAANGEISAKPTKSALSVSNGAAELHHAPGAVQSKLPSDPHGSRESPNGNNDAQAQKTVGTPDVDEDALQAWDLEDGDEWDAAHGDGEGHEQRSVRPVQASNGESTDSHSKGAAEGEFFDFLVQKKTLPKGLGKQGKTTVLQHKGVQSGADKPTGHVVGSMAVTAKKAAVAAVAKTNSTMGASTYTHKTTSAGTSTTKKAPVVQEEEEMDDGWGDAWE